MNDVPVPALFQPATGRFTQADPLPPSIYAYNRYAYVGGNPADFTDPRGMDSIDDAATRCLAGAALAVVVTGPEDFGVGCATGVVAPYVEDVFSSIGSLF